MQSTVNNPGVIIGETLFGDIAPIIGKQFFSLGGDVVIANSKFLTRDMHKCGQKRKIFIFEHSLEQFCFLPHFCISNQNLTMPVNIIFGFKLVQFA
jgi:hypothetical protein